MRAKITLSMLLLSACVLSSSAAVARRNAMRNARNNGQSQEEAQDKMDARVAISQMPNIGAASLIVSPSLQIQGGSQPISKMRRQWGVYEMTFRTAQKWTEDLTVNWYVLCDTSKAKQKDKSKTAARVPEFVFYTLVTRYVNIPDGDHRSCACLPPSFIERYGEPVVISCEIVTAEGKLLAGANAVNGFSYVKQGMFNEENKEQMEWWNNQAMMDAKDKKGQARIEVRQGLIDRSKSPFYLVNNADYEAIQ